MASARAASRRLVLGRWIWAMSGEVGSATMLGRTDSTKEMMDTGHALVDHFQPALAFVYSAATLLKHVTIAAMTRRTGRRTAAGAGPDEGAVSSGKDGSKGGRVRKRLSCWDAEWSHLRRNSWCREEILSITGGCVRNASCLLSIAIHNTRDGRNEACSASVFARS